LTRAGMSQNPQSMSSWPRESRDPCSPVQRFTCVRWDNGSRIGSLTLAVRDDNLGGKARWG
jgi:hypothetical protein